MAHEMLARSVSRECVIFRAAVTTSESHEASPAFYEEHSASRKPGDASHHRLLFCLETLSHGCGTSG
jgi:hypothetical protein